jgi:hypothetical protein
MTPALAAEALGGLVAGLAAATVILGARWLSEWRSRREGHEWR